MSKFLRTIYIILIYFLEQLVKIECIALNNFTGQKGNGPLLRLWLKMKAVKFGKSIFMHAPFYLFQRGALKIGNYCSFGEFTKIWNFVDVEFGDEFLGAAGLTVLTGGHDPDTLNPKFKPVVIGKRVWCGANVIIMPGVTVGDDVVIGSGALVTADIPNESIVVGSPARVVGKVDMTKRKANFYTRSKF
jgi:acetyltransferase-like isoleucine patch superfamily enzyme